MTQKLNIGQLNTLATFDSMNAPVTVFEPDGRILYFNPHCEKLSGYSSGEMVGTYYWNLLISPEDRACSEAAVQKASHGAVISSFENRWACRSGEILWFSWSNSNVCNPDGSVRAIIATGIDLTERKRAEAELARTSENYRNLMSSINGVIWEGDPETHFFRFFSSQAKAIFGFTSETLLSDPDLWWSRIHPDDRDRMKQKMPELLKLPGIHQLEFRFLQEGGHTIWIRDLMTVEIRDGIASGRGIMIDVTDEKRNEVALKQARTQLELALGSANMAAWHLDIPADRATWLGNAEEVLGINPGTFAGTHEAFVNLIVPEDREKVSVAVAHSIVKNDPYAVEFRLKRANGEVIWCLSRGVVLRDAAGKPEIMTGIIVDISELKKIEAERERSLEATRQAVQLREDFISIASHELKTPITPLKIGLTVLRRAFLEGGGQGLSREQLQKMFDISDDQLNRLIHLVDNLLDVSHIRVGKMTLKFSRMSLADAVVKASESLRGDFQESRCTLEFKLDPHVIGQWDRLRVGQVITNLLSNALKYGAQKPVCVTVSQEEGYGILQVSDHGIGIAPDAQARIFRRFERAVSKRSYSGLGLGLFITKQIVVAHEGHIDLFSEPGQGTTFTVKLPLRASSHPADSS
ncbi:MAG: PAS domain-containing sensor histidine kinase [Methylotenera sp.]|nr:PAS domain-containing sensor histidine kinase [Oligoflexia bacterium]